MPLITFQQPTRSLRRFAAWVGLITITFAVALGLQSWQAVRDDQVSQLTTAVQIGARAVDRYLAELDAGLRALEPQLLTADGDPVPAVVAAVQLRTFHDAQPDLAAVTLLTPQGRVIASSVGGAPVDPKAPPVPGFAATVEKLGPETSTLVGHAVIGPASGRWVFGIVHVMRDRSGTVTAVVVAGVPVELLQSFMRDAPLMQHAATGLLRDDGYLVSRYPLDAQATPEKVFGQARRGALQSTLVARNWPRQGYVEGARGLDEERTAFVFRRLEHFPLTLFVALPMREYVAGWWQRARAPALLLLVLVLGGAAGFRYALRQQAAWAAERRSAEAALQASEAERREVLDRMPAGVVLHDGVTGAILWSNARAAELLGLSIDAMRGATHFDPRWHFLREDGGPLGVQDTPVGRVIATGLPVDNLVIGVVRPDRDTPTWVMGQAFPDRDATGALRRVLVAFVDITDRRLAERALAQRERTYRLLFDNSSDAVLHTRPNGRVLTANPAACSIFGLDEEALRHVQPGVLVDVDDPGQASLLRALLRDGRAHATLDMRRGDGTPFQGEVTSTLYTDADGAPCCCVVVRDVTDLRRAEAALRAKALAEEANRAKSSFVARMSHELRTPLNAILGFSDLLREDDAQPLTPMQHERLGHVRRAGEHLLHLINDLLDVSRIEAGALGVRLEDVDLVPVVHDAVREMSAAAAAAHVRLELDAPRPGLALHVRGDALRLRQIVLNLVSNAIKYNRAGGGVHVALEAAGARVRLVVRDNGLGMTGEQLAGLFQPFNRLGREASSIEGTGIGLVVTRSLVEMMDGTLTATSRAGEGSDFVVEFPLGARAPREDDMGDASRDGAPADAPRPAAHLGDAVLNAQPSMPAPLRAGATCHALYIDDDEVNRELMRAYFLLRPEVRLCTAADGAEGLRLARELHPQLVLIDLMMPGLDGFDVLAALRADPAFTDVRCVVVSANAMPAEIEEALAAGFDAYLTKPLSSGSLIRLVDRFLDGVQSPSARAR